MRRGLAPSYKAAALALLNNDMRLTSLGFQPPRSKWYDAIKRVEIEERAKPMAETNKQVSRRIDELRMKGVAWAEVAKTLNKEGLPSLSGKPWSHFMAVNYNRAPARPAALVEQKPNKTASEHKLAILEGRLFEEIRRNIELEKRLASFKT